MAGRTNSVKTSSPFTAAFEAALVAHHDDFLGFLRRRIRSVDEAEEVLQQFYLRAIRNAQNVRKEGSVVAWLYSVLRSTLIDHYRREAAHRSKTSAFVEFQMTSPIAHEPAETGEICPCLYEVLPTLRPDYYNVLWRVDLEGQERLNVARLLGLTLNNLTVRLHRARQALKRELLLRCPSCSETGFADCACDAPRAVPRPKSPADHTVHC